MKTYVVASNFTYLNGNDRLLVLQMKKIIAATIEAAIKEVEITAAKEYRNPIQFTHIHLTLN